MSLLDLDKVLRDVVEYQNLGICEKFKYMKIMKLFVYYLSWKFLSMWLPCLTKGKYIWTHVKEPSVGSTDSLKETQRNQCS